MDNINYIGHKNQHMLDNLDDFQYLQNMPDILKQKYRQELEQLEKQDLSDPS